MKQTPEDERMQERLEVLAHHGYTITFARTGEYRGAQNTWSVRDSVSGALIESHHHLPHLVFSCCGYLQLHLED